MDRRWGGPATSVLMYHSVSSGRGPTCMAADRFRRHLDALVQRNLRGVSLVDYLSRPDPGAVVLTFDDGHRDLLEVVAPELARRDFRATVFLACDTIDTGRLPGDSTARLLNWEDVGSLHRAGWEIGSHASSHQDLARMAPDRAQHEIAVSRQRLEQRLGAEVVSFAAPFGSTTPFLRQVIARHYQAAVGTRLGLMEPDSDLFDLPRLEMFYFRNSARFEAHLDGRGGAYLGLRRWLRATRQRLSPG